MTELNDCIRCGIQYDAEDGKPTEFCSRNCAEGWLMNPQPILPRFVPSWERGDE